MLVSPSSHEAQALSDIFCRFVLGEGMTKKSSDLASEVEEQTKALQAAAADKKEAAAAAPAPEPQGIKDEDVPDIKVTGGTLSPDVLVVQGLNCFPFHMLSVAYTKTVGHWAHVAGYVASVSIDLEHLSSVRFCIVDTSLSCMVHHKSAISSAEFDISTLLGSTMGHLARIQLRLKRAASSKVDGPAFKLRL